MNGALRDRLREAEPPGADEARERAWPVVRASAAARPVAPRRRLAPRALVPALGALAAVVLVVSGGAAAPAEWAIDRLRPAAQTRSEPLTPLPRPGRLLLRDDRSGRLFLVHANGKRTALGRWSGASWSPRGRFAVAWRGRRLAAITPSGKVRWSLRAPATVWSARWSPDGFRIAYVTADRALRVVNGDGSGPRQLARTLGPSPAWRPGAPHTLAWVRADRTIAVRDADTLAIAARPRARVPDGVSKLDFAPDGRRLLALGLRAVLVLDLPRGRATRIGAGRDRMFTGAAFAPRTGDLALARLHRARDSVITVAGRDVLTGQGAFSSLAWSPDGGAVVAAWPRARQAVAVGVGRPSVVALPEGSPQGWSRGR